MVLVAAFPTLATVRASRSAPVPFVLEGTDDGTPALTRYARVVITVVTKTDAARPIAQLSRR